jgi:hypothetical protein
MNREIIYLFIERDFGELGWLHRSLTEDNLAQEGFGPYLAKGILCQVGMFGRQ